MTTSTLAFEDMPLEPKYVKRLTDNGYTTIAALCEGIRQGGVAEALKALGASQSKAQVQYSILVDWLAEAGQVERTYKHCFVGWAVSGE